MQIKFEQKNDVMICYIDGDIDINTSPEFNKAIEKIARDKAAKVVINFEKVGYVDSSGLATVVAALKRLKTYGGRLKLVNLSTKVKNLFEITRLDKLFEIIENEQEAIKGFV